jgi:hypothetical protein
MPATEVTSAPGGPVAVEGSGSLELGQVSLSWGLGTIGFAGAPASAFVFEQSEVPPGTGSDNAEDGTYYGILAVQPGRLIALWLLCEGGQLVGEYHETTDGLTTSAVRATAGVCGLPTGPSDVEPVHLPDARFAAPPVVHGYSLSNDDVFFDGKDPGQAAVGGQLWTIYPYHAVDCTACGPAGWYELHTLFVNSTTQETCFGIFYLGDGPPQWIGLDYFDCPGTLDETVVWETSDATCWTSP